MNGIFRTVTSFSLVLALIMLHACIGNDTTKNNFLRLQHTVEFTDTTVDFCVTLTNLANKPALMFLPNGLSEHPQTSVIYIASKGDSGDLTPPRHLGFIPSPPPPPPPPPPPWPPGVTPDPEIVAASRTAYRKHFSTLAKGETLKGCQPFKLKNNTSKNGTSFILYQSSFGHNIDVLPFSRAELSKMSGMVFDEQFFTTNKCYVDFTINTAECEESETLIPLSFKQEDVQ